jgi:predicted TIM-barrel fold metal-dependent hydrolase
MPAVDSHAHVFSANAPAVIGARYRPAYAADLAEWRSLWAPVGITHGVIVQPSFFGSDNRELLETLASDQKHLRGVAVLNPFADVATLERFHRGGVRAVRLNLKGVSDYLAFATPAWHDFYARVAAIGWHIEVFVDAGRLPEVVPLFEATTAALVFDHFGALGRNPRTNDFAFAAVRKLAATREVWCKFSAPYRFDGDPRTLARQWLEAVGPRRVVWGSDWPWTRHEEGKAYGALRARLDEWVDLELREAILWDNPARLYRFA